MTATYESVLTGERYEGTLKRAWRALCLPLGVMTYPSGRQILFNASRKPLWQRSGNTAPSAADPNTRMPACGYDDTFYWPGMSDRAANAAACAALVAWGVPIPAAAEVLRVARRH